MSTGISLKMENMAKILQRHCEEVYTGQGETRDVQEKSNISRRKGTSSSHNGRIADLVLQATAKLSVNKVKWT